MNKRKFMGLLAAGAGSFALGALANYRSLDGKFFTKKEKFMLVVSEKSMYELTSKLVEAYSNIGKQVKYTIENGVSQEAIIAAKLGSIDVAAITRDLTDEEDDANSFNYLIARSSISIIVNRENPIENLTSEQVRRLLTGDIRSWADVKGSEAFVNVMSRDASSSTRQYLEETLLKGGEYASGLREFTDAKSLSVAVAKDVNAIGFVAAKDAKETAGVKRLRIDNVPVEKAAVLSGRYPLSCSFYLLLAGENEGPKKEFVDFALSIDGQKIVERFMPVC